MTEYYRDHIEDYLHEQLEKLSNENNLYSNGNLASDSLAMLEIIKYLDKEKKLKATTKYLEHIDIEKLITEQLGKLSKNANLTYY